MLRGVGQGGSPCRTGHARKSSFVFIRSPCLWFLLTNAVKKSRSQRVKEWETQSRPRPSRAGRVPEGGGGPPTSRLLNCSTAKVGEQSENVYENKESSVRSCAFRSAMRLSHPDPEGRRYDEIVRNKARMSMKTKEEVKKSRSQGVEESGGRRQASTQSPSRSPERRGWLLDSSTSRLFDSQNRGNKARMSMKTKDKYKMSLSKVARTCT